MESYDLGDITLQSGEIINGAKIAYKTYGALSEDKSNAILYPTWYSGFISDNEWLIGEGKALDPEKYFIVIVCLFGNGQSSSPTNCDTFSNATIFDNVTQQHRLITEHFGISVLQLVVGWSMGAGQTYQWAASFPDMVLRACPFAGSARTAPHNFVFLDGLRSTLEVDLQDNKIRPEVGMRAFARVYAGWGFSQPFYKAEKWRQLGYSSLEDFLVNFWEAFFLKRDHRNLLTLLWTWQQGDISNNSTFNGDLSKALGAIKAKTLLLCPERDLYFPPDDNRDELEHLNNAEMVIIPGIWGHFAGGGINQEDTNFIDRHLKDLLAKEV